MLGFIWEKYCMEKRCKIAYECLDLCKCYICGLPIIAEKARRTEEVYGEVICYICMNNMESVDKNKVREYLRNLIGLH